MGGKEGRTAGGVEHVRDILEGPWWTRAVVIADQTREQDRPGEIDGEKLLIRKMKEKKPQARRLPSAR